MVSGWYVYAIVPARPPLAPGLLGFGDAEVSAVVWRDLAAAVSHLELAELNPVPEHLLRHEAVVEALRGRGRALPVRFGTVLPDPEGVARALAERADTLAQDLVRVGDKVELGLTAFWDTASQRAADASADEGVQSDADATPAARGRGAQYLLARLAEHRQTTARKDRARALAAEVDAALRPHAVESRYALVPAPRLALRAALLTEPDRIEALRAAFEGLRREHPDVHLVLTGPWSPYTFVTPLPARAHPADYTAPHPAWEAPRDGEPAC